MVSMEYLIARLGHPKLKQNPTGQPQKMEGRGSSQPKPEPGSYGEAMSVLHTLT